MRLDIDTYRKWKDFQMTSEMNWKNIEIDHVKPISSYDAFKDEKMRKAFNWINTQHLLKKFIFKKDLNLIFSIIEYNA